MKRQILFAHSSCIRGKSDEGTDDFLMFLKDKLQPEYEIIYAVIENSNEPSYEMWKAMFDSKFPKLTTPVILIGHSLGGSMLLKYLTEENEGFLVSGLFLISIPYWGAGGLEDKRFMLTPNFEQALENVSSIYLYQSTADTIVPFSHLSLYRKELGKAFIRKLPGNDHEFVNGLPILIDDILAHGDQLYRQ